MKRIYSTLFAVAMGSLAVAQFPSAQRSVMFNKEIGALPNENVQEKALGTTIWSNDFSVEADWTIGAANVQGQWVWTTTTPTNMSNYMGDMASTSNANGFGAFDGVQFLLAPPVDFQDATLTYNGTIDCSGASSVMIEFEQMYRAFNYDDTYVEYSLDGTNWVPVMVNEDVITNDPAVNNTVRVDASSALAGQATVYLRFRWKTESDDDNYGSGYGWAVDDVKLVTKPDYDLKVSGSDWESAGLHYYQIPNTQVAPIDFWTTVSNEGGLDMTNVQLNVDVNSGAFTGASTAVTIAAGASDSLYISTPFTPSGNGTYDFTWNISSTETDDVPGNNGLTGETFEVVDFIYARDMNGTPSYGGGDDQGDFSFEAGNLFDIYADDQVYSVDVVVGSGTPNGTLIYGKIYVYDGTSGDFVYVDETAEYTVGSADVGNTINMILFQSPTLTAGNTYYAVVGTYSEFYYGTSGTSPAQTCFIAYQDINGSAGSYYTTSTPMVRMNFDPSIGVEEIAENGLSLGQNMPNPFGNTSKINFEMETSENVRFEFVDVMGKVVKTMNLGKLNAGTHSVEVAADEFAAGVYYYSLIAGSKRLTNKMIVE